MFWGFPKQFFGGQIAVNPWDLFFQTIGGEEDSRTPDPTHTQTLNVWHMFTYIWSIFMVNLG